VVAALKGLQGSAAMEVLKQRYAEQHADGGVPDLDLLEKHMFQRLQSRDAYEAAEALTGDPARAAVAALRNAIGDDAYLTDADGHGMAVGETLQVGGADKLKTPVEALKKSVNRKVFNDHGKVLDTLMAMPHHQRQALVSAHPELVLALQDSLPGGRMGTGYKGKGSLQKKFEAIFDVETETVGDHELRTPKLNDETDLRAGFLAADMEQAITGWTGEETDTSTLRGVRDAFAGVDTVADRDRLMKNLDALAKNPELFEATMAALHADLPDKYKKTKNADGIEVDAEAADAVLAMLSDTLSERKGGKLNVPLLGFLRTVAEDKFHTKGNQARQHDVAAGEAKFEQGRTAAEHHEGSAGRPGRRVPRPARKGRHHRGRPARLHQEPGQPREHRARPQDRGGRQAR
jgi:hypothetical protein